MIVRGSSIGNIRYNRVLCPSADDIDLSAMNGHNPDGTTLQRFLDQNLLTKKGSPAEFFQSFFGLFHMAVAATFISNPINSLMDYAHAKIS